MNVLVLNTGSSSLKFQVIDTDLEPIEKNQDRQLARGVIERIGSESLVTFRVEGKPAVRRTAALRDHRAALDYLLRWLVSPEAGVPGITSVGDIHAVGHRCVHGGEKFTRSVKIDDEVVDQIEDCIDLAPLHNPANLKGIYAARELLGQGVPQVAVFDTVVPLHHARGLVPLRDPVPALRPAPDPPLRLPRHLAPVRGLPLPPAHREVARGHEDHHLHLGNGCSACAIDKGESVNTSMGLTPLEGLRDGHPRRQHRPVDPRVPPPQGGPRLQRDRRSAQQAVGAPRHLGSHERHARAARGGARPPGPRGRGSRSSCSACASSTTSARTSPR